MKISIAGAGAGKTTTLSSKIVDALDSIESYQNIYCLAFTNAAVSRIKEKLYKHYVEIPPNIIVSTLHSFLYKEIISPYYFLLFGKHYERISPINLPDTPAFKNNKIKELDDRGIIHISVIPQRAKWVVVKRSGDKRKTRIYEHNFLKRFLVIVEKFLLTRRKILMTTS